METAGFWTIASSPIWMAFILLYASARTRNAKRLWAAAVIILAIGWALYGLPDTPGVFHPELFIVVPATFISVTLALWARYLINREPLDEDAFLNAAEALEALNLESSRHGANREPKRESSTR